MQYGRFYEEFSVGDVYKHWPGRTITDADNTWFSLLSQNQHPVHIDNNYVSKVNRLVMETLDSSIYVMMNTKSNSR